MSTDTSRRQESAGTSEPSIKSYRGTNSPERHAREDALSAIEYERGVMTAYGMEQDYHGLEHRLVWFLAGRIGLRAGEIAHMRASWIDSDAGMIEIPHYQPCTQGRDGSICGHCHQHAKQLVDIHGISLEEAEGYMWGPKTKASAREIAYDATPATKLAVEDYFDRYDRFQASKTGINRRVKRIAEETDCLDREDVYPHCLRASAATHLLANDLSLLHLKVHMGWKTMDTLMTYADENHIGAAEAVREALR